jgi:hypothetical protein
MTQPIGTGYPDFGRYIAHSQKLYADLTVADIDAATDYGPYFVGDVPHIGVRFTATTLNHFVFFRWQMDQPGTVFLADDSCVVNQGNLLGTSLPVKGPWLRIGVTPSAANAAFTLKLWSLVEAASFGLSDPKANILLGTFNTAVAAGATSTLNSLRPWPGAAVWTVFTALATWEAQLGTVDFGAAFNPIDSVNQANPNPSRSLFLPMEPVRTTFTNNTGAAGTYRLAVMARPIGPGR